MGGAPIGLKAASRSQPQATTPFLPADLVDRLCSASGEGAPNLAVARSADGMHPVFGLWPVTLAPDLEASLMSGERKVSDWVRQRQAREVMFPPLEIGSRTIEPFFNINRADDLAAAEAFL